MAFGESVLGAIRSGHTTVEKMKGVLNTDVETLTNAVRDLKKMGLVQSESGEVLPGTELFVTDKGQVVLNRSAEPAETSEV